MRSRLREGRFLLPAGPSPLSAGRFLPSAGPSPPPAGLFSLPAGAFAGRLRCAWRRAFCRSETSADAVLGFFVSLFLSILYPPGLCFSLNRPAFIEKPSKAPPTNSFFRFRWSPSSSILTKNQFTDFLVEPVPALPPLKSDFQKSWWSFPMKALHYESSSGISGGISLDKPPTMNRFPGFLVEPPSASPHYESSSGIPGGTSLCKHLSTPL